MSYLQINYFHRIVDEQEVRSLCKKLIALSKGIFNLFLTNGQDVDHSSDFRIKRIKKSLGLERKLKIVLY